MDEYSLWLQTNVSSARQDHVRAFADDLGDLLALKQTDVEQSSVLDLASWPEAARIRFVRAWRELKFPDGYSSDSSSCSEESVGGQYSPRAAAAAAPAPATIDPTADSDRESGDDAPPPPPAPPDSDDEDSAPPPPNVPSPVAPRRRLAEGSDAPPEPTSSDDDSSSEKEVAPPTPAPMAVDSSSDDSSSSDDDDEARAAPAAAAAASSSDDDDAAPAPAPASALRRASVRAPRTIRSGAVVEATPQAFGHDSTNSIGARAQYRGTVVEPGTAPDLPLGCPPTEAGERIWRVRYDADGLVWTTPERFLAVVAPAPLAPPAPADAEEEEEEEDEEDEEPPLAARRPPRGRAPEAAPPAPCGVRLACEIRRVGSKKWRRFASRTDADGVFPGLSATHIGKIIANKPDVHRWVPQHIRDKYEVRNAVDESGSDSESDSAAPELADAAEVPAPAPAPPPPPDTTGDEALARRLHAELAQRPKRAASLPDGEDKDDTGPGDRVFAFWDPGDKCWGGTVIKLSGGGQELLLDVIWDDGNRQDVWGKNSFAAPPPGYEPEATGPNAKARALIAEAAREGGWRVPDHAEAPPMPWDPLATEAPPPPRRAPVPPRVMDPATLSEGQLREEAKRRKLNPRPSDGKRELLAKLSTPPTRPKKKPRTGPTRPLQSPYKVGGRDAAAPGSQRID